MRSPYGRDPVTVRAFSCLVVPFLDMGVHRNPLPSLTAGKKGFASSHAL